MKWRLAVEFVDPGPPPVREGTVVEYATWTGTTVICHSYEEAISKLLEWGERVIFDAKLTQYDDLGQRSLASRIVPETREALKAYHAAANAEEQDK